MMGMYFLRECNECILGMISFTNDFVGIVITLGMNLPKE